MSFWTNEKETGVSCAASLLCFFVSLCPSSISQAQLRIVTYNTATSGMDGGPNTPRTGMDTVLQAAGDEVVGGISKPIDALVLQEQEMSSTSTQAFVDLLNGIYGAGTYARATVDGGTLGGGRPGLVYNTQTLLLDQQIAFGTLGGNEQARQTLRYRLRPVGYDSTANFYVYAKAAWNPDGGDIGVRNEILRSIGKKQRASACQMELIMALVRKFPIG